MVVTNLAPAGVSIVSGLATLPGSRGWRWSVVTAHSRSADIDGGASGEAVSIVRGDVEGEYPLRAVTTRSSSRSVRPSSSSRAASNRSRSGVHPRSRSRRCRTTTPTRARPTRSRSARERLRRAGLQRQRRAVAGGRELRAAPDPADRPDGRRDRTGYDPSGPRRRLTRPSAGPSTSAGRSSRVPGVERQRRGGGHGPRPGAELVAAAEPGPAGRRSYLLDIPSAVPDLGDDLGEVIGRSIWSFQEDSRPASRACPT